MDWGTAKGLAVDLQYNQRIADQRFYDQQFKRAQAENLAELKAFEDDTDYMNAANSFDHNLIKAEAEKTIKKMGEIIRDNPNYKYDPDVRRELNQYKKYLKSNPEVIRGMASDENFKKMNEYLQEAVKNPQMHSAREIEKLKQQQQNYLQFGNQGGKESYDKYGKQTFVFERPANWVNLKREFGKPYHNAQIEYEQWKMKHGEAKSNGSYQIDPFMYDIKKLPVGSSNTLNTELVQSALGTTPEARIYNIDGSLLTTTKGLKFIPNGSFQKARTVEKTEPYKTSDGRTHYYKQKEGAGDIGVYHGYVEMTEDELDNSGVLNILFGSESLLWS